MTCQNFLPKIPVKIFNQIKDLPCHHALWWHWKGEEWILFVFAFVKELTFQTSCSPHFKLDLLHRKDPMKLGGGRPPLPPPLPQIPHCCYTSPWKFEPHTRQISEATQCYGNAPRRTRKLLAAELAFVIGSSGESTKMRLTMSHL